MRCSLSTSSSSSSLGSIASISVASQSSNEMSDDESLSVGSDDEIPIWVHGEQRWISGITADTTCAQLVEALLRNECMNGEPAASSSVPPTTSATVTAASGPSSSAEHQYVITERWRRVEQSLDNKTKILKIWKAWGQTKSEVKSYFLSIMILISPQKIHTTFFFFNCVYVSYFKLSTWKLMPLLW